MVDSEPATEGHRYTHGHHESVLRSHRWRTAENSAGYLLPWLRPGQDLLDVGCGPGTITVDLARRVGTGRVVGLDNAEEVIDIARASALTTVGDGPLPNLQFIVGDVSALDVPDASFDVVHAHQVLQHLPDPVGALAEMGRVCRPGGLVAARDGDYRAFAWYPADPWLDAWLDVYGRVARHNGGEPDGGRHLMAWARAAGFTQVTGSASAWCFSDPDDCRWWGELWADRMTESAIGRRAVELGIVGPHDLREIAGAWHRWAAHPDAWFGLLHGEILCRVES